MIMTQGTFLSIVCSVILFTTNAHSFEPITLGIPHFKPYTYTEGHQPKGIAVTKVERVFERIPVTLNIKSYLNYSLLLKALKRGDIDGFFLATKNNERSRHAIFSKPIEYNNWAWFTLHNSLNTPNNDDFKYRSIIGTIGKTNTFRWLSRNGYQVQSFKAAELLTALIDKKIHAVFLAQKVFEYTYTQAGMSSLAFKKHIEMKRAFGIYISKQYIRDNDNFMSVLNTAIPNLNN
jgi:ABC-type amino acid transport substrate-binding protein